MLTASDYRPSLPLLGELRQRECSLICLSATLLNSLFDAFLDRLHLQRLLVIRASSDRLRLCYDVRRLPAMPYSSFGSFLLQAAEEI